MRHIVYDKISTWEAIALLELLQGVHAVSGETQSLELLENNAELHPLVQAAANIHLETSPGSSDHAWHFHEAYRLMEEAGEHSYHEILAKSNARDPKLGPLLAQCRLTPIQFKQQADSGSYVVLAPYSIRRDLELPENSWRMVARELKTFAPLYVVGREKQRLSRTEMPEADIASDWTLDRKIALLSGAAAVVGAVNEWTWISAGFGKHLAYTYPQDMPPRRWFMHPNENFGRIAFEASTVQTPILLAQIRVWLQTIPEEVHP